jgi:peroxiredoxin
MRTSGITSTRRRLQTLLLGALIGIASLATASSSSPAPDFKLPSRSGGTGSLSQYKGQVVMINFWASWCGPCRQEFPLLDNMYKKYKSLGFTLLGVNVDKDSADAEKWLAQTPVTFPILFDRKSEASNTYQVNAMPTTVFVDRKGQVRLVHRAYKPGDEVEYLNEIKNLLKE